MIFQPLILYSRFIMGNTLEQAKVLLDLTGYTVVIYNFRSQEGLLKFY